MSNVNQLLTMLSAAPDDQIAEQCSPLFLELVGQPLQVQYDGLYAIHNDCVRYSLASDFSVSTMNMILDIMRKEMAVDDLS